MQFLNLDAWPIFIACYSVMLIITLIMMVQSRQFYTLDPIRRKFSIMELEVPASPKELANLVRGLYKLPAAEPARSIASLKDQLGLDFLFMPLAYGSIFLLNWRVAHKLQPHAGYYVFMVFAFLQCIPWICDIIENVYLLGKIDRNVQETSAGKHKAYLWMEGIKWGLSLVPTACAFSAVCYFWLTGDYSGGSLKYLLIFIVETLLFLLAPRLLKKRQVAV